MGVDEPGIGDVLAELEDLRLVVGARQDLVTGADRDDHAVLDEDGLRNRRIVHRDDPSDDDEAAAIGHDRAGGLGRSCRGST